MRTVNRRLSRSIKLDSNPEWTETPAHGGGVAEAETRLRRDEDAGRVVAASVLAQRFAAQDASRLENIIEH
jgi:hypothetical protein